MVSESEAWQHRFSKNNNMGRPVLFVCDRNRLQQVAPAPKIIIVELGFKDSVSQAYQYQH